ncbi:MAG TPA: transposase [Roseiflexaceae bacterium]|nr:transposase [Roseiflexaceae bacterium]
MARATTPSFVCELPLVLSSSDERQLGIRLDCARQVYNAVLGECLRRLALLRQSKVFQTVRLLRGKERREGFRALDAQFGMSEYDPQAYAKQFGYSWIGWHLDANTVQAISKRAWNAVRQYQVGVRGRPRFKGKGQFHSVEGTTNKQGIRWRDGRVLWGDDRHQGALSLRARIPKNDPVVAHALSCRIKYVRIVRRTLNGTPRYFVQLICEGLPYQKPQHTIGQGVIGIDPGPRTFAFAGAAWGAQVDLSTPLGLSRQQQRRLQRQIDRQRRANNPGNYLPDGRVRSGPKRWHKSQNQRKNERRLAEAKRKEAAHRKTLHGRLANVVLRLGNDVRIERNSYRSFQKTFGKAVGQAAPATFVTLLARKASSAGVRVSVLPTSLRLSQTCLCGAVARKPLAQRVHRCRCGITVQRDVWSAYLARWCVAVDSPQGLSWRLDADQARVAWSGVESRFPAASSPVSVPAFVAWAQAQSASDRLL